MHSCEVLHPLRRCRPVRRSANDSYRGFFRRSPGCHRVRRCGGRKIVKYNPELFPVRGAFLVGLLLIAALIFGISLPPVQDYPNHLARYWLIAGGASVPPTSGMFAIDWRNTSINVGADLIVALLAAVVPYWLAGKILLVGAFVGPPAAAAWLNRILFGRWTWWSLCT